LRAFSRRETHSQDTDLELLAGEVMETTLIDFGTAWVATQDVNARPRIRN
jgi:hypothetical protein